MFFKRTRQSMDELVHAEFNNIVCVFVSAEQRITDYMDAAHVQRAAHLAAIETHNTEIDQHDKALTKADTLLSNLRKFLSEKL